MDGANKRNNAYLRLWQQCARLVFKSVVNPRHLFFQTLPLFLYLPVPTVSYTSHSLDIAMRFSFVFFTLFIGVALAASLRQATRAQVIRQLGSPVRRQSLPSNGVYPTCSNSVQPTAGQQATAVANRVNVNAVCGYIVVKLR